MLTIRFQTADGEPEITEVDRPTIGATEVLVEMQAASICGSDVYEWDDKFIPNSTPTTLGYGVLASSPT